MLLHAELDSFRSEFMAQAPPGIRDAMVRADMELADSSLAQRASKAVDRAPDFPSPDARGRCIHLSGLLATGAIVLIFYRGGCSLYCIPELKASQQVLPEIMRLGATLVAVSPQTPDASLSTAERNALAFPVLSDAGSATAKSFADVDYPNRSEPAEILTALQLFSEQTERRTSCKHFEMTT